jgi:flap endonuclease-1
LLYVRKLKKGRKKPKRLVRLAHGLKFDMRRADEGGTAEDIDKLARRQVRVTKEHNEECKRLLALMGIPVVTVSPVSVVLTLETMAE